MNELIKLKTGEGGKRTVSAKELYLGLGLNKKNWSRWYPTNIQENEFFKENYDYTGVRHNEEGNETWDFEISLEFAKHIAMMARTEKSHQYRNYFLVCESKLKEQQNMIGVKLSPMEILETQFKVLKEVDSKVDAVTKDFTDYKENSPLFNIECDELQAAVKRKGVSILGGKDAKAYKDKPIRTKLYADIQREIKRQFGLHSYKALKRSQLDIALGIVDKYAAPLILVDEITVLNNQIHF